MGAVPGLTQATQQATTAAQQADLSRELAAQGRLAGLEQAALTGNIDLQRNLEQLKLQRAMGSEATAAQNLALLEAQRGSIGPNVAQGLSQTATALAANPGAFAEGGKVKYGHGGEMKEDVMIAILQDSSSPQ